jgi:hypothetical protein
MEQIDKIVSSLEAIVQDDEFSGIKVYPFTVGTLRKNGALLQRIGALCKENNITLDNFMDDPMRTVNVLGPMTPEVLCIVTRRTIEEVDEFTIDVATGVLAVALRLNLGYIRKTLGSGIKAAVLAVAGLTPSTSSEPSNVSSPEDIANTL